ncbi:MAG: cysteine desulfurase family protein [Acidimicrobiia bacterium]
MIYLDHAATSPMRPGVWESMAPFANDRFGNSSGVHEVSRRAKNALEEARERIAALIGATPIEIVFTSGGTESDNLALKGAVLNGSSRSGLITVATEHEAVLETADFVHRMGHGVTVIGVDRAGQVMEHELAEAVTADTVVVSAMMVNNETGLVSDVRRLVDMVKGADPEVLFHTDAVQGFSSEEIDVRVLGVDLMTITGHKFGGPKGAGLLYVREGTRLEPLLHGGGQEMGRRSGTHDVAGAVGLATAMEQAVEDRARFRSVVGGIRDDFEKRAVEGIAGAEINTGDAPRSSHHLNLRVPGVRNQTLLLRLDQARVAASAGSACQSGAATVSHVLESMGLTPAEARESLRFSFGWSSTLDEAVEASSVLIDLVGELR